MYLLSSFQFHSSIFNFLVRSNYQERTLEKYCATTVIFRFHSLATKQFAWNESTFIFPLATPPVGKGQQNSGRPNDFSFLVWHQLARHWEFQNCKWWYSFIQLFLSSASYGCFIVRQCLFFHQNEGVKAYLWQVTFYFLFATVFMGENKSTSIWFSFSYLVSLS